jgi:large subunit ribosomal protein L17
MRHRKRTAKLGRTGKHRNAMLANLVCSLIKHRRITTTLAKAKAARSVAEKLLTLGKGGTLQGRRLVAARLRAQPQSFHKTKEKRVAWRKNNDVVRILFEDLAPTFKDRPGGYTRILKLAQRTGDAAPMAILEWVDLAVETPVVEEAEKPAEGKKKKGKKSAKSEAEGEPKAGEPAAKEASESEPKK